MVPFPVTLSDRQPRFQGHGVIIDALNVLCAQLTCDLFTIAKFLFDYQRNLSIIWIHCKPLFISLFNVRILQIVV